jgi:hypothetical protein
MSNAWVEQYADRVIHLANQVRGRMITEKQTETLLETVESLRANIVIATRL